MFDMFAPPAKKLLLAEITGQPSAVIAGAGLPVKEATRGMAPALPVFAAKAAPTMTVLARPVGAGQAFSAFFG